jgi:hypothetical protein
MADPFNYQMQVKSPFEAAVQGYALGEQINAATAQREANLAQQQVRQLQAMEVAQKIREAQALREEEAAFQQEAFALANNPAATATDWRNFGLRYPRQQKQAQSVFESLQKEQQEIELRTSGQVAFALKAGKPEQAAQILEDRALASENSGRAEEAKMFRMKAQAVQQAPEQFLTAELARLSFVPGAKDIVENITKTAAEVRAQALAPEELALTIARRKEAEAGRLAPSVREAIDYANLPPEKQQVFQALQIAKKPPAAVTNVNVTTQNIDKTAAAELGKDVSTFFNQANAAATALADLPRYRASLDAAITGPFANQRLGVARVASAIGLPGEKGVEASRVLIQGMAEMALNSRSMLTGQGAITENEQKLLAQARSGDISFTKGELNTIFNVAERAGRAQYDQSSRLLRDLAEKEKVPTAQYYLRNIKPLPEAGPVATPSAAPAAGAARPAPAVSQSEIDALIRKYPAGGR